MRLTIRSLTFLMIILIVNVLNVSCSDNSVKEDQRELFPIAKGQYGFIDRTGKIIVNPQFVYVGDYSEGLIAVRLINNKYGFIDKTGKFIINPQFESASTFSEGLACVKINEKYGYIDKAGNTVIQPQFIYGGVFSEGLADVAVGDSNNYKRGYIDKTGKFVIEPKYEDTTPFSEGLASVGSAKDKFGFIDKTGNFVISQQFTYAGKFIGSKGFSEGLAVVHFEEKKGFIDKTGNFIIKPEFDFAEDFSEGLAIVGYKKGDKTQYGYINKSGQVAINFQFDFARSFSEGLAVVSSGEKMGYIGTDGKYVVDPQYGSCSQFNGGIALVVTDDGKEAYIDKTGKYVWDPEGISSTFAKASNNENNSQTETKPTEDIIKKTIVNLTKNRPLWDPLRIKPGLTGSIRNIQIDSVSISRYGNYNEVNKYWPVQVNISGSLESPAITRVIRCTFSGSIDVRLLKNDYGDWKAEYNQETDIPRLSCEQ